MQNLLLNRLFLILLVAFGSVSIYAAECSDCPGDFNHSHHVDQVDLDHIEALLGTSCDDCCEDMNGDGFITVTDYLAVVSLFGTECDIECSCYGDLNGDLVVDQDDLYDVMLPLFGTECPGCCSDMNEDGIINVTDIGLLLSVMGNTCPDCSCPGDFDESGYVDTDDITQLIMLLNQPCDGCCEDLNDDGMVDMDDLFLWLPLEDTNCDPEACDHCPGDFDFDLDVDDDDALLMLIAWPGTCDGCCEDLDSDGDIDQTDLQLFNELFGNTCDPDCGDCLGDFDFSLAVDQADLDIFLAAFGQTCEACCEDLDNNGVVGASDLGIMLSLFGTSCEAAIQKEDEVAARASITKPIIKSEVNGELIIFSTDRKTDKKVMWVITTMDGNKEIIMGNNISISKDLASVILFEYDTENTDNSAMTYRTYGTAVASADQDISIFPNPSSTVVNITSNEIHFNALKGITITDLSGKLIQNFDYTIDTNGLQINTNNFHSGTYILSLEGAEGNVSTEMFQILK